MFEFFLYVVPGIVYVALQRRKGSTFRAATHRLGIAWGPASWYGWAVLVAVALGLVGWLAVGLIPGEALASPGVSLGVATSISAVLGVVLRAVGEELFFRGLVGGVLMRRLGFAWGNLLQAAVFLVPHLLLLLVDVRLWPIIPVQFVAGWVMGWLRHRSGSVGPSSVVHVIVNVAVGAAGP